MKGKDTWETEKKSEMGGHHAGWKDASEKGSYKTGNTARFPVTKKPDGELNMRGPPMGKNKRTPRDTI